MGPLIFIIVMVAVYAAFIVPQQRKVKAQRHLLSILEEGDVVLTSSGIYGVITEIDGGDVYIEVAEGIELKMTKSSIAGKVRSDKDQTGDAAADKDSTTIAKDGAKGQ